MADTEYHVVFRGELTGDLPKDTVKQHLCALFKMPHSRVEALFSGNPVVVKKGVDEATARKFEAAFRKAGAICELQDVTADRGPNGAATDRAPAAQSSGGADARPERAREGAGEAAATATASAAEPNKGSVAAASIAAAGDPNQTIVSKPVPKELGDLQMSAPGEPLVTEERDKTPPAIDTSDLSLSDEPLGDGRRTTGETPDIDTSDLRILPPE